MGGNEYAGGAGLGGEDERSGLFDEDRGVGGISSRREAMCHERTFRVGTA